MSSISQLENEGRDGIGENPCKDVNPYEQGEKARREYQEATKDVNWDQQVGGNHYRAVEGEQHWDRVARLQLDYFQGQITSYVERWKLKDGLQDLHKARHYLNKYIDLIETGVIVDPTAHKEAIEDARKQLLQALRT